MFLDRDGVINRAIIRDGKPYPPRSVQDFQLLPGVEEACRVLKSRGLLLVVATNQPDVGRGLIPVAVVESINATMCGILPIDRVEVCYDANDGESSEFRKPAPGMLLRAASALHIDLNDSFMVGDRWRDVDCGRAAGCTTFFVDHHYDEKLRQAPDFVVANLLEAAQIIDAKCRQL